jgi:outer membrane protein assembly factor BamE (lipoprotein component of BamABCDE complex)
MNMTKGMSKQVVGCVGVPPRKASGSRFPLQVLGGFVPQPPVGFPLQSLTRALLLFSICLTSCDRSIPFEKNGWQKKSDFVYPKRDAMVQDLMDNHKLVGLTTREVRDLLGSPDYTELGDKPNWMTYQVVLDFGWDIDPVHTKDLVLEFNQDSVVTKVDLLEWKK